MLEGRPGFYWDPRHGVTSHTWQLLPGSVSLGKVWMLAV